MFKHCLLPASAGFFVFQLMINFVMAQGNALLIEELDKNGGVHSLEKAPYIVDINSTLKIKLNKDALRSKSASLGTNPALQDLIDKAEVLRKLSEEGLKSISPLQAELASWADPSQRDILALQKVLKKVAANADKIIDLAKEGTTLRASINQATAGRMSVADQYRTVFETAATEADRLRAELDRAMKIEGVYYQLGAWISTKDGERPLHLEGFDNYPKGEEFEVGRWNLALTQKQKTQLHDLNSLVKKTNEDGLKKVTLDFARSAPSLIQEIIGRALPCIDTLEQAIGAVQQAGGETLKQVKDRIDKAMDDIKSYREFIAGLKTKYTGEIQSTSQSQLLISINSDLEQLKTQTDEFINGIKSLKELPELVKESRVLAKVDSLKGSVESCEKEIKNTITNTTSNIKSVVSSLFSVKKIDDSLLEFGDEVLRLDIDSLPDTTELPLKTTGVRASGDAIIVKMAAGKKKGAVAKKKDRLPVGSKQIQLYRILSHTDVAVGIIYALPQEKGEITNDFRLAPSYSVIYSWGIRSSIRYNTLFKPGIGINFAALDLNHDDTPEVGIGVVLAIFRNFLQVGGGYNLQQKVRYGFFGLRFPIPSLTPSVGT